MKTKIELNKWNRKEHFEFFKNFNEPFYNLTIDVECSKGLALIKEKGYSVFAWYLYSAMKASNQVKEFRYRIEDDAVYEYDLIHASPTIGRVDGTFGFAQLNFTDNFTDFQQHLKKEADRVRALGGLFTAPERPDVIHYSSLPWFSFTGLTHPRNFGDGDSIPKISFGKIFEREGLSYLPLSVHVHHALVDGFHVSQFIQIFSSLLNKSLTTH